MITTEQWEQVHQSVRYVISRYRNRSMPHINWQDFEHDVLLAVVEKWDTTPSLRAAVEKAIAGDRGILNNHVQNRASKQFALVFNRFYQNEALGLETPSGSRAAIFGEIHTMDEIEDAIHYITLPDIDIPASKREVVSQVRFGVASLGPRTREVLMEYISGTPIEELAASMGYKRGVETVQREVKKAIEKLWENSRGRVFDEARPKSKARDDE